MTLALSGESSASTSCGAPLRGHVFVQASYTIFSSFTSEQPWEASTNTIFSDEEPETLKGNMTYPRSPLGGNMMLSKPHYLLEPPASLSVKGGSGHPSQGSCEDL